MFVKKIKMQNFRNYKKQEIDLKDGITIFFGNNAQGKTNILESIYICSMGKSFRTNKDKELINFENEIANIEIDYEKSDRSGNIQCNIGEKKVFKSNGIKINKLSEIIGKINIVLFSPDDIEILKQGPNLRRKFLDILISQLRPNYINLLNSYMKVLEQRNNFLKNLRIENRNIEMLDVWDEQLANYGTKIKQYREEFINKLQKKIKDLHMQITENKENIIIQYVCEKGSKEDYFKKLQERRKMDISKGYTTSGIHRDDFKILINNKEVNVYGSQGQHRTAMLSLKLAELNVIYDEIGEYPILLLDDFMSELDVQRRNSFLEHIKNTQVIITCTDKLNIENLKFNYYKVENGKIMK